MSEVPLYSGGCTSVFERQGLGMGVMAFRPALSAFEVLRSRLKVRVHTGTSLMRKRTPLGPYRRPMPRVLWRS